MATVPTVYDRQWFVTRLRRHMRELTRLAVPAVMMRIGLMGLAMVDTAMVGHYATQHLAWLNLANQSIIMFVLVVCLGLLSGVIVYTANAYGSADFKGAGKVWRRSLPFSLAIGTLAVIVCWPAELWLTLLGQSAENAAIGGDLVRILAVGLPGHILFVNCTMFLEGIKRPHIGFRLMIAANLVNVILNYGLIFGHFGFPELGAAGSAFASTGVRWVMALLAMLYIWNATSLRKFQVRLPHGQALSDWKDQRQMGYAGGTSLAAEVIAFSALAVFAGWLGVIPLAAFGVVYQVLGIPLMISIGIGVATSVRVGIALSRRDGVDAALAGLVGLLVTFAITGILAVIIYFLTAPLLNIFTKDMRIIELLLPFALIYIAGMVLDAAQMVASMILRGYKETWWPTYLQGFAFVFVMLPASYYFAFTLGHGFKGLMEGMLAGVTVSFLLQTARFTGLARRAIEATRGGKRFAAPLGK